MVVFTIIAVLATVVVATVGVLAFLLANSRRRYAHLPCPPMDSFWFGHAFFVDRKLKAGLIYDQILLECSNKYGQVFVLFLLHVPNVIVTEVKAIRQIVSDSTMVKPPDVVGPLRYIYGHRFLGKFIEGETDLKIWSRRQKPFAPFYHKTTLCEMVGLLNEVIDKFIAYIDKRSEKGEAVDMKETFPLVTSTISASITLGSHMETVEEMKPLYCALGNILKCFIELMYNPLSPYLPSYKATRKMAKENSKFLRGELAKWIMKRRKEISESGCCDGKDILSLALKETVTSGEWDSEVLVDIVLEGFHAAHTSSSYTLRNVLREILNHPEVEKRVVEEVDQVLEGKQFVSSTDIQSLPYLTCVMKETFRLHPTLPSLQRGTNSALTAAGYVIPVGSHVHLSVYCMHLNEKYWVDPMKFNPDRFNSLTGENDSPTLLPFGGGTRPCLGRSFAEQEITMVMARLFQVFTFQLEEQSKKYSNYKPSEFLLTHEGPLKCKIKRRLVEENSAY